MVYQISEILKYQILTCNTDETENDNILWFTLSKALVKSHNQKEKSCTSWLDNVRCSIYNLQTQFAFVLLQAGVFAVELPSPCCHGDQRCRRVAWWPAGAVTSPSAVAASEPQLHGRRQTRRRWCQLCDHETFNQTPRPGRFSASRAT